VRRFYTFIDSALGVSAGFFVVWFMLGQLAVSNRDGEALFLLIFFLGPLMWTFTAAVGGVVAKIYASNLLRAAEETKKLP
jgi:hypothetical protein